jgi:hypothetical protein
MKSNYFFFSNLLIVTIFLIIPLDVILNNYQLMFPTSSKYFFLYVVNVIFFIFLNYIFFLIFKKFLNNKIFINILFFLLIWIIINGLFFPSLGLKDDFWDAVSNIRLRYQIMGKLVICFVIFLVFFKSSILRNNLKKIFITYLSIILVSNLINISFKLQSTKVNANLDKFGNDNFLVISFDGINGNVLKKIFDNKNFDKSNFKDFILYPNYTAFFPSTINSISSELIKTTDINKFEKKNLLINDKKIIDNVYTYGGAYDEIFLGEKKLYEGGFFSNDRTYFLVNLYRSYIFPSFSRWATFFLYKELENFYIKENSSLFIYITKILSFNFSDLNNNKTDNYKYLADIHRISQIDLDKIFNKFDYDINISTKNIYFFHFVFSHYRIRLDQDCNLLQRKDYGKFQSFNGNLEITNCVIKKMNYIINKLKENNVYDSTTIIFKSDHGKPIGYHENQYQNIGINNNIFWGPGRYNAFYMIKKNNFTNSKIQIKNEMILSNDIYTDYCDNFPIKIECTNNNSDLIYIPTSKMSFIDNDEFESFKVDRSKKLYKQLIEQDKLN